MFNIEVDAKYIKGMINNPDIQPNNAMNQWIAAILLFTFELVHVPVKDYSGPDGLSRRREVEGDVEEREDGWLDQVLGLGLWEGMWIGHMRDGLAMSSSISYFQAVSLESSAAPTFLSFSLNTTKPTSTVEMPRIADDTHMDSQLPIIFKLLPSMKVPADLDNKARKQFIQWATKFFVREGQLWRKGSSGMHQLVICYLDLITQAHNQLRHKQAFWTHRNLTDGFWWPGLYQNITWFIKTCHQCQLWNTWNVFIPPMVTIPAPLFQRVHLDTMFMPKASGLCYIVQARCSLMSYAEFKMHAQEMAATIGKFIFTELLCRRGAIAELITDNSTPIMVVLDWLAKKYKINHIHISVYNKQANGLVEHSHHSIWESIVKACDSNISRWPEVTPHVFWTDCVTVQQNLGYSPFYIAHGIEPILPFDVTEATFLIPKLDCPLSTEDLIAIHARQLQKRPEDLAAIKERVLKACYESISQFEKDHTNLIMDYNFTEGALVLVWNSGIESNLSHKTKPCYLGLLVVVRHTQHKAYILAELDSAIHKSPYTVFRIIPYHPRSRTIIPVTSLIDPTNIPNVPEDE